MKMMSQGSSWLLPILFLSLLSCTFARRGQDLHCGVCRALVDELEWEISQVDPKKTIQKGSFRINPDGTQSVTEAPYARSEAHLMEVLERVCEKMTEYGERTDPSTHRKTYERILSRDGKKMDASNTNMDREVTSNLKFTICVTMLCIYLTMNFDLLCVAELFHLDRKVSHYVYRGGDNGGCSTRDFFFPSYIFFT
ncbi:protein canopy homolog 2 isoform X1 [Ascaphus truei]|uniref:protein canopy homolog 2 isoform X1 n=1 Tax=Ascaphus truei TaxID=8439 RepID=UPI003F59405A